VVAATFKNIAETSKNWIGKLLVTDQTVLLLLEVRYSSSTRSENTKARIWKPTCSHLMEQEEGNSTVISFQEQSYFAP